MNWKNNKRIHVAVGVAVVVLAVRWMFAPTLQDAALAYSAEPPAEGNLADPITGWALAWPVVELGLALLAGLGAYVINAGAWILDRVKPADAEQSQPSEVATTYSDVQSELIHAIATNDTAARVRLEPMIRGPEAMQELNAAVAVGDFDTATAKLSELKKLAAQAEKLEASK